MDLRVILLLPLLAGCGTLTEALDTPSGNDHSLGTHNYTVAPDGTLTIEVRSLYGGPGITVERRGDGTSLVTVQPAARVQLERALKALR